MSETNEEKAVTSKVLFDGINAKVFLSSIKIILGLQNVYNATNFPGNETNTEQEHQTYLDSLETNTAPAKAKKLLFDRARLIIALNTLPTIRDTFERLDAFQMLQMLHKQCSSHTFLQQSLEISNRLDAIKEEFTSNDRLDKFLIEYSLIYTQAKSFGNGLDSNIGSQLLIHASRISTDLKDHLNIWQAGIPGDPESFTFVKVHDKIKSKLSTLKLVNQIASPSSYLAHDAPASKSCDHHKFSKSHTTEECSITRKMNQQSDYSTRSGPPSARPGRRYTPYDSKKSRAWSKSKASKKPWSSSNPNGFMTRALVASTVKEAISSFTNQKDQSAEIASLKSRLEALTVASQSTSMNFLARVVEDEAPVEKSYPIDSGDFLLDYSFSDEEDEPEIDPQFAMVAMTLLAGSTGSVKVALDSASTHSLVGNVNMLIPNTLENSTSLPISGFSSVPFSPEKMGTISLTTISGNTFTVSRCHVVPSLGNLVLLSVGALTRRGIVVLFKDDDAVAYHDNKVLFSASRGKNNLYHLDLDLKVCDSSFSYYSVTENTVVGSSNRQLLINNDIDSIINPPSTNNPIYAAYIISTLTNPSLKLKEFIPSNQLHIPIVKKRSLFDWHCILGHANADRVKAFAKESALHGISFTNIKLFTCDSCLKAHSKEPTRPKTRNTRASQPGQFLHADLSFNEQVPSFPDKYKKFCVYVDDASNMYFVVFIHKKSEVHQKFSSFANWLSGFTQTKLERLQVDGGTEYKGEISKFIIEKSVEVQISMPNEQWQNARAERATDIIWRGATALLIHANLPESLWPDAVRLFVRMRNMLPSAGSINPLISCYQIFTRRIPNLSFAQIFGQVAWFHVKKENRLSKTKTSARSLKGIFLGYPEKMKGYIILDPLTMTRHLVPIVSRFVHEFPGLDPSHFKSSVFIPDSYATTEAAGSYPFQSTRSAIQKENPTHTNSEKRPAQSTLEKDSKFTRLSDAPASLLAFEGTRPPVPLPSATEDSKKKYVETLVYCLLSEATADAAGYCPKTFRQATQGPDSSSWKQGIDEEVNSLLQANVFEFTDTIPADKKPLRFKWVFKRKIDASTGLTSRFKARLTAMGNRQVYGEDYWATYAPCVSFTLVRVFLSIAASRKYFIHLIDIKTAYLNGTLDEEIYGIVPEGMESFAEGRRFMRILRSLYGLRQSGRIWALLLQSTLKEFSLVQSTMDVCIFTKELATGTVFVLFHVDDIVISVPPQSFDYLVSLKKLLLDRFKGKDCGQISQFLNIMFDYRQEKGILSLSLAHYINSALRNLDLLEIPTSRIPMDENYLKEQILNLDSPLCDKTYFQKLIGILIYISTMCRPDITTATLILSRQCANPRMVHMEAALKIFGYLKRTSSRVLKLGTMPNTLKFALCDSDFAGSPLPSDEMVSRTGYVIFVCGGAVSWYSKMQTITTSSSTHAEFVALFTTTQELNFIIDTLSNTKQDDGIPSYLFNDNSSANTILISENMTAKSKHFRLKFLCAKQSVGITTDPIHISTHENLADLFTKPLSYQKFSYFADRVLDPSLFELEKFVKAGRR